MHHVIWQLHVSPTPRMNHGIQTAYEFAADAGGMERSRYFGFSKDLYHLDHFLGGLLVGGAGVGAVGWGGVVGGCGVV